MSSKKKYPICHLLYEEYPRDPRVRRYVNAANQAGAGCVVICSKKKNETYFEELSGNRIYRIPVSKKRASFFVTLLEYLLFTCISSVMLFYFAFRYRFRIIHVHTLPDFLVFAAFWNKIFGTRIILDLHEIFPEFYMARTGASADSFKVKLLKTCERWAMWFADIVLTIHDNAKEIFLSRNKGLDRKLHVIMNSVDPNEFDSSYRSKGAAAGQPGGEFNIVYNGTVVKLLNLTMIVEALERLKQKMPAEDFERLLFRIYGDGPVVDNILSLAAELGVGEKVKYMGYLQPGEMRKEVLNSNVLILPPLKNIYSDMFYTIKLIEAIYLGIPVIATRLNTYLRYYGEGSLFYFDSGDVDDLCMRIEEVFYNRKLVEEKTKNAFNDYEKLNWSVMRERYIDIIRPLLQ